MYNNNLNNHWSIYPRSFNILIHIPRIIHQQSPPFFSRSPGTSVSKGVLSRDGQPASSKARLKQGLSSGLPPSFALASCTHSVRIVLENESLSLPLSLFADVARNRPNLRVPSVFHPAFFFLSFFFQINFNPRQGERPIVNALLIEKKRIAEERSLKEGIRYVSFWFVVRGVWSCLFTSLGWNVYQEKRKCLFWGRVRLCNFLWEWWRSLGRFQWQCPWIKIRGINLLMSGEHCN